MRPSRRAVSAVEPHLPSTRSERQLDRAAEPDELLERVRRQLAVEDLVREELPRGGRIHVERALPFLCIYRQDEQRRDPGTERFVTAEPAYLLAPASALEMPKKVLDLLLESSLARFGGFLLLEIRTSPKQRSSQDIAQQAWAQIVVCTRDVPHETVRVLEQELHALALDEAPLHVSTTHDPLVGDLLIDAAASHGAHYLVVELDPVHYDPATGAPYPLLLRSVRDELSRALRNGVHAFCRAHTRFSSPSAVALGRQKVLESDWDVDRRLAEIARSIHLLLYVTPVNAHHARKAFLEGPGDREPRFHYRHVTIDPDLLTRRLYEIPLDEVEDPTLLHLFREQRASIAGRLRMLADRNTRKFLYSSLQLFGGVSEKLLRLAMGLTAAIPPGQQRQLDRGRPIRAEELVGHANDELRRYRAQCPTFEAGVEIRDDVAGILVDEGRLLIERGLSIVSSRIEALLQHEIGTHVLTHFNGSRQPMTQLATGLAGYDELQEGLAVLSEYLVGQLVASRLRLLAGRVIAVNHCIDGGGFLDIYRSLTESYGFRRRTAFDMAMRVSRGGGFTKDVVYLRGLVWLLAHLERGHALDPLFIGKPGIAHLPAIEELVERGVLAPPAVRPRYLEGEQGRKRLSALRKGVSVLELVERRRT